MSEWRPVFGFERDYEISDRGSVRRSTPGRGARAGHVLKPAIMRRHGTHHNTVKTHCVNGHEFTPENTLARPDGGRRCRTCRIETSRRTKANAKAKRRAAAA